MLRSVNWMSVLLLAVVALSVVQGAGRGAGGSARSLFSLLLDGVFTIVSLLTAWRLQQWLSPLVRDKLLAADIRIPGGQLGWGQQMYYTFLTGLRDFPLMRSGLLLLAGYLAVKLLLRAAAAAVAGILAVGGAPRAELRQPTWLSSLAGGGIGVLTGSARALLLIAVLFVYSVLYPDTAFTAYVQQSSLYQKGATGIIQPVTGDYLKDKLPVFTRAVESEFHSILQRKYEVLDANVPDDIALAAKEVTAGAKTDEEKAKALYQWVGTRVRYDWDKVNLYEQQRIWKEQTPDDTFRTKEGVCIDYSRLYAVMARSVGLDVKVVTGLGYDGKGSYGPHAWNEVYLSEAGKWVPLDSTWVSSGGNWFNPPGFDDTHIRDA
ncbi:transglutaminase domain-containing protein [Paenibacillus sp. J31TS4]|uniref:transglutaminase domain-containing protein n=1 Tax=Paenibacillus sp. J31TS4 TaxID=2807195 RepID=UPI001BCE3605|nr:transglutaminase-like domain-containing protein [Paenibacillus sp. J31TS4]